MKINNEKNTKFDFDTIYFTRTMILKYKLFELAFTVRCVIHTVYVCWSVLKCV